MTYFFGPLFGILGWVKVEKMYSIGDFDKNTKNALKSSFLSFFNRERAKNELQYRNKKCVFINRVFDL
jgi:hypothetical protein